MARGKSKYACYGVWNGVINGIYTTWSETEKQVKGYPGAGYRGFQTLADAIAHMQSLNFQEGPDGTWSKAGVVKVADAQPQAVPGPSRPPLQPIQPPPRSPLPQPAKPARQDGLPVNAGPQKFWAIWSGREIGVFHRAWPDVHKLIHGYPRSGYKSYPTPRDAEEQMLAKGFTQDAEGRWNPPAQHLVAPVQPESLSDVTLALECSKQRAAKTEPTKYWAIWSGRQIGVLHQPWSEVSALVLKYPGAGYKSYATLREAEQRMLAEGCTKHADGSWHAPPTFAEHQPSIVLYDRLTHDIVLGDPTDEVADTTLYYRFVETTQGMLMVKHVQVTVKETIEYFDYKAMQRALDALQRKSLTWAATIEALEDESIPWEREDIRSRMVQDYHPVYLEEYSPHQVDVDEVKQILDGTDAFFDVERSPVELYNGAQGVGRPRMLSTWEVVYVACSPEGGIGVFFGDGNARNVSERYHDPTKAELVAVARALEAVLDSTSGRILLQTEFKFDWKMLRPRFSALEDPLRTYLSRLFDSYLPRVRIRVQHVEDVYDCGMVRAARAAARALAWYPDEEDEAKWDFDWEKKKRLLTDREEDGEEEEAPGLEIYD
ncbi:hypothetical protein EXIGLDRAFT_840999 [Exidia glandulosa HHB12029]|uniref:Ribonuclease H1 N-terminal domain-containing protein n=1 Tax=Exidia glandulosa HHB12029 TaxID=1314781 RepID=A0A165E576_EXIGL|nr:hypothetical protein EXIGLDRAFT_840999 [Exidia glandulosa HHB12029]